MSNYFFAFAFLFCFLLNNSLQYTYPKNKNILDSPKDSEPNSIQITTKSEILSYLQKYDNVIAVFHMDWCGHCRHFLPIFDEASRYHITKKFKFLKINCDLKDICVAFKVDRFPTIKVFNKGNELKLTPIREIVPLLEFLEKLSSDPFVKVTDKKKFYDDYGTFSPYVEYNEENTDFIACVSSLARNEFLPNFFFGVKGFKGDNSLKQKIFFEFDGMPITYEWDGDCTHVEKFLKENKYPLVNEVTTEFIKSVQKDTKLTFILDVSQKNEKQKKFAVEELKKISYHHREFIIGYIDSDVESELLRYFGVSSKKGMQILIFDFNKSKRYIHPQEIDETNVPEAVKEIEKTLELANKGKLKLITGNFFEDLFISLGMEKLIPYMPYIALGVVFGLMVLAICLVIICDKEEPISPEMKEKKTQ